MNREYDLEERLLDYSSDIIEVVDSLKPGLVERISAANCFAPEHHRCLTMAKLRPPNPAKTSSIR